MPGTLFLAIVALNAAALTHGDQEPELLWDNGLEPYDNGHAHSPPGFPNIRVADDFYPGEDWLITGALLVCIEDIAWERSGELEVSMYLEEGDAHPGAIHRVLRVPYEAEDMNRQAFNRPVFHYHLEDLSVHMSSGDYWLGFRDPDAGGKGTSYWLESYTSGKGTDGEGTYGNCRSLDGGQTWSVCHSRVYNHLFHIYGYRTVDAAAFAFEVTRGDHREGGLVALSADDDTYMVIAAERPSAVSQSSIEVVVEGFVNKENPSVLAFSFDGRATAGAVERLDMYNFATDRWERMHETLTAPIDRRTDIAVTTNVLDYIEANTGRVRARIGYWDPGITRVGWFGLIDLAVWRVGRPTE